MKSEQISGCGVGLQPGHESNWPGFQNRFSNSSDQGQKSFSSIHSNLVRVICLSVSHTDEGSDFRVDDAAGQEVKVILN